MSGSPVVSVAPKRPSRIEWVCRAFCFVALLMMLGVVAAEVVLRSVFSFSLGFEDEMSSYFLVMLCFFALTVTYANNGFHRVEFVINLMSPRGRQIMKLVADVLMLVFIATLVWQFVRVELQAIRLQSLSATVLRTPQWIPMLSMAVGTGLFLVSLLVSIFAAARAIVRPGAAE